MTHPPRPALLALGLAAFVALAPSTAIGGVRYEPSRIEISLPEREAEFRVFNETDQPLMFRAALHPWDPKRAGDEDRGMSPEPAYRALIYPQQITVPAGETQIFRVLWRGQAAEAPVYYRLAVGFRPPDSQAQAPNQLRLGLGYNLPVLVYSGAAKPDLRIVTIERDSTVRLRLHNAGRAPASISEYRWAQGEGGRLRDFIYPDSEKAIDVGRGSEGPLHLRVRSLGWVTLDLD